MNMFLEMMELTSKADEVITIETLLDGVFARPLLSPLIVFSPLSSEQPLPSHLPPAGTPTTLRSLLTNHLDIRCSPRKSFFEWLRRLSTNEMERERLDEFIADPVSIPSVPKVHNELTGRICQDEIHTYATRPSRTIVETLADFRFTRIPISHILEILPPLRRRQFSIASSWEVSAQIFGD